MSTNTPVPSDDDLLAQIWSLSSTMTEEAMSAALKTSKEKGFDENRGLIPLQESFINLSSARVVLQEAIEKQKLVHLPITVQREVLSNLQAISKALQGLADGTDEVVNLTNSIEALNTSIWKFGFHNLSDQVLGYQKKLNQLKNLEVQLSRAMSELETTQKALHKTVSAAEEIERKRAEVGTVLEQVQLYNTSSAGLVEQIKETGVRSTALYSAIQQEEKQSGELTSSIRTANNELGSLDASIRKFYGEVEDHRKKINQTNEDAANLIRASEAAVKKTIEDATARTESTLDALQKASKATTDALTSRIDSDASEAKESLGKLAASTESIVKSFREATDEKLGRAFVETATSTAKLLAHAEARLAELGQELDKRATETISVNRTKTEELIQDLAKLKDKVSEQIQQATGFTLFGAFQSRQNEIARSKNIWVYAIGTLVAISAVVTIWIAHEAQYYSVNSFAFWVKLSLTVPLGFAITFCTVQYSRERRLEEEYAFKSSISVSLNPYRDLIHSILEKDGAVDKGKYTDFVVDAVRNVFTPPTDKVFEGREKSGITEKTLKKTAEIIGTAVKAATK